MKKLFISLFVAIFVAVISPSVIAAPNANQTELLNLMNTYRSWSGLHALVWDDNVANAAQTLANECAYRGSIDNMTTRLDGREYGTALTDLGIKYDVIYTIAGINYNNAQNYFMDLINSPNLDFKTEILSKTYTRVGFGISFDSKGNSYSYLIFIDGITPALLYPWASQYQLDFLSLVNTYRSWYGAAPLALDGSYSMASATLANELSYNYSEFRPDGRKWYTVLEDKGISSYNCINFYGKGYKDVQEVLVEFTKKWSADFVNPSYTKLGIAYTYGYDGNIYWSFIFG